MPNVSIIGGGISGLACLYRLRQLGIEATLFEKSDRAGGVIRTTVQNGFLFETGPQSFLLTEPLRKLIREIGLESELVKADPKASRFVLRGGRLHPIPMAPGALLRSSLLSVGTKTRLLTEPFRRTKPPALEESVADFVRRKFGNEILDYLVAPFVSGVYAGDPEKLSLSSAFPPAARWEQEYGSVLRGAMKSAKNAGPRPSLASFREGMNTLPRRLSERMANFIQTNQDCGRLRPVSGSYSFDVQALAPDGKLGRNSAANSVRADAVVLATPAYASAQLLPDECQAVSRLLAGISYAPVAIIAAGYDNRQFARALQGFGFLAPRKERLRLLGTVWNSSLFPGRAPEGKAVITSFAGGATDLSIVRDDAGVLEAVTKENAEILEISGPPVEAILFRYDRALPQYTLGHADRLAGIGRELSSRPGLFLAGNYMTGPSIGNCVERAFATAESIGQFFSGADAASSAAISASSSAG